MKYTIEFMTSFKKGFKKIKKQGKDENKLYDIIEILANGKTPDKKYKDHALKDDIKFKGCRELHIEPNWLLVYKYDNNKLILFMVDTGSHSELFNM